MISVNTLMMVRMLFDRTQLRMTEDEARLFAAFRTLTPGEFRLLMSLATWRKATTRKVLAREGARLQRLYYVLDGAIGISKAGRSFPIESETFIGEVAFLRARPASATVTLEPGARYVEWPTEALTILLDRNPMLRMSLNTLFNIDMAGKVARA
jgi:CRP-like cAMP-binding protein